MPLCVLLFLDDCVCLSVFMSLPVCALRSSGTWPSAAVGQPWPSAPPYWARRPSPPPARCTGELPSVWCHFCFALIDLPALKLHASTLVQLWQRLEVCHKIYVHCAWAKVSNHLLEARQVHLNFSYLLRASLGYLCLIANKGASSSGCL